MRTEDIIEIADQVAEDESVLILTRDLLKALIPENGYGEASNAAWVIFRARLESKMEQAIANRKEGL